MELLEREALLGDLDRLWEAAGQGHGRFVFVGGEAGVGKTSLIRAFIDRVGDDARLMMGWCDPLSTPRPLGPLIDMAGSPESDLARLLDERVERDRLLPGVLAELQRGPVLMVVEDVHWADEATLDLLRYLGRRVERAAALVLVTYRDDELGPDHPLKRLLGDLATVPAVQRLRVEPLSEAAVRMLAGEQAVDAAALYRRTGGNPFYVTEILATGGERISGTVRDAVLVRASRLSPEARDVLAAAAVIGPAIETWLLERIAGGAMYIDECIAHGLVRMTNGGLLEFRHELAREAIYDAIPVEQRRLLHRDVLAELSATADADGSLARLAHHAEAAGDAQAAVRFAKLAAERAKAVSAHREAAAQYQRVLRFERELSPAKRAEVLEAYAVECLAVSYFAEGIAARGQAAAVWSDLGDHAREAENLSQQAGLLVMDGRNAEGEQAMEAAMSIARSMPETLRHSQVYRLHAVIRMLNRDTSEAIEWGQRAQDLAERFGEMEIVIGAENAVGSALLVSGDIDAGIARLERSRRLAEEHGYDRHLATALSNLGSALGELHQFRRARDYLLETVAYAVDHDIDANRVYGGSWLALCELHLGNWATAADLATAVLNEPNVAAIARIMANLAIGRLRARRGDPEVWDALDQALALAEPTATLQRLGPVRAARAEAAWLGGNRERCANEAGAAYGLAIDHQHAWFVGELAYWQWKAGALGDPPKIAAAPYFLQMTGEWEAAAAAWEELGCPYEAARARAESGDERALRDALRTFELLDARPMAAMTIKALRDLGARRIPRGPRPSTRAHVASLTAREAEVLQLLMAGRRNAEIADVLFLSPKTVEHHVSSILAKLGVRSRFEAVDAARALGL
jgi:predicted ATPase/DNA-binding CsgD family transcriptional regulator